MASSFEIGEICVVRANQIDESTTNQTLFLTNIDQHNNCYVKNLFFYNTCPGLEIVMHKLQSSLEKVLVPYYFLAGRLKLNQEGRPRLEVDCNNAGVFLASASAELDSSTKDFDGFFLWPSSNVLPEELPLLTIQVTHLRESNEVAIGALINHAVVDANSGINFFTNLASMSCSNKIYLVPNPDRTGLKAGVGQSQIKFAHPELVPNVQQLSQAPAPVKSRRTFFFSFQRLAKLKEEALQDGLLSRCSTFEALAALIWRAHAQLDANKDEHQDAKLMFTVGTRNIMEPPLGADFCGNAIYVALAKMSKKNLFQKPISYIVKQIQEARERITDGYMRSALEFMETHPDHFFDMECGTMINALPKEIQGAMDLDFGWGSPSRVEFPHTGCISFSPISGKGIHVSVSLDHVGLKIFPIAIDM